MCIFVVKNVKYLIYPLHGNPLNYKVVDFYFIAEWLPTFSFLIVFITNILSLKKICRTQKYTL